MQLGMVGLGRMGGNMAERLRAAGHEVVGYANDGSGDVQSLEELAEGSQRLGGPVPPEGTRRNVTLSHGRVPTRPGTRVRLGSALLEVVRKAAPCRILDDEIAPGAARALHDRAGTILRVLESGGIEVGDTFVVLPSPDGSSR